MQRLLVLSSSLVLNSYGYQTTNIIFVLSLLIFILIDYLSPVAFPIYWRQNRYEGTLNEIYTLWNYTCVNLAFLYRFGDGKTPKIDLAGHCNPNSGGCTILSSQITYCRRLGIMVMLSLGGDAKDIAKYLSKKYLGGESSSRPLWDAISDSMDIDIELEDLLDCGTTMSLLDKYLDQALNTNLFDYVWAQFDSNTPCEYTFGIVRNHLNS
ncbi:hypothetical protein NE237_023065 [Protea cynaroides]|uniref:chitinase n=1 Tax=Protea cynaroides TaxID=273540 RepID=A0A9Q0HAS3_9MAGN|nr:hypothetical protein NE237_023065 [Protea cynaroides]